MAGLTGRACRAPGAGAVRGHGGHALAHVCQWPPFHPWHPRSGRNRNCLVVLLRHRPRSGLGLGAGGYALAQQGAWRQLPTLFWAATILWLLLPVVVASYQEQADLRILLRFPVSLGSYFRLYLISGLMEASTIVGALCCLGIWIGIVLARPRTGGPLALVLVVFAVFNILLVRAVFAWIDRWLAQRRSREILGAVFMVVVLGAQFLNPALYRHQDQGPMSGQQRREQAQDTRARYAPILRTAYEVQQWLPAGAAARAVEQSAQGHSAQAMAWLDLLGIWALVCRRHAQSAPAG